MSYSVFNPQVVQDKQPSKTSQPKAMSDNPYYLPLLALLMPAGKPSTVMPCFPAGSVLPSPAGRALMPLDPGVASTLQRALVASVVLVSLPICDADMEDDEDGETGGTGSLANFCRYTCTDWLTWQTFDSALDQAALSAADVLTAQAMLRLLADLATDFVLEGQLVWGLLFQTDTETDAREDRLEALIANIRLNRGRDVYRKCVDMRGPDPYTIAAHVAAKRMDKGAHSRPHHDQVLLPLPAPISDAGLHAVNKVLTEPFGGRTLLAALFIKLLLGHLSMRILASGRPTPGGLLVCDRALTVLNAVIAQPDQALAGAAATVAGALRRVKLKTDKDGADVLHLLPVRLRTWLPACFKRDLIHLPEDRVAMASAAFTQAEAPTAQACLSLIADVAALAQHTACLMFDMLASGALGLGAEQFQQLEARADSLKRGGVNGRLKDIAPDADFRANVLLPQLQRAFRYFSWMGRVGADTVTQVRERLHHQAAWPAVPQLTTARRSIGAQHPAPTR